MSKDVICPYCGHQNKRQKEHDVDMQKYGKTCFSCNNCCMLFTLRDDGDGEFVSIRERITISTRERCFRVDEVLIQIDNYIRRHNKKPNHIILGVNLRNRLIGTLAGVPERGQQENYTETLFGIPVTVDYKDLERCKVGYME